MYKRKLLTSWIIISALSLILESATLGDEKHSPNEARLPWNQNQLSMLSNCAQRKDMTEWNEWRNNNRFERILLQHAHFWERGGIYLRGVDLRDADLQDAGLERADLQGANLQGADLRGSQLQDAYLQGANLQGADLQGANLQDADLRTVIVDGSTLMWDCRINHLTDFRDVGVDSISMESKMNQALKYNIRRLNWGDWYKAHILIQWPTRFFWWVSDYGSSTIRVVLTFFISAIIFAFIYCNFGISDPGFIEGLYQHRGIRSSSQPRLIVYFRALCFSVATMTTFGFGKMHANPESLIGQCLVMIQIVWGYIILGAFITRLAILFTSGGPAG